MPALTVNGQQLLYRIEGDGFPLVLVPDAGGTMQDWEATLPLLGEICRVIVYEYQAEPETANDSMMADLVEFFHDLEIERAYVAGYARGGEVALRFARRHPERSEGVLCISPNASRLRAQDEPRHNTADFGEALPTAAWSPRSVPVLVIAGETAAAHVASAAQLATQLSHCSQTILPKAGMAPHRERPLPLGHAMLQFLIHCERQRTLVRGASFLL
jgi:pimeloyl-ACP methyl ester carboxylesterase